MPEIQTPTERAHHIADTYATGDAVPKLLALLVEAVERLTTVIEYATKPAQPVTVAVAHKLYDQRCRVGGPGDEHATEPTLYEIAERVPSGAVAVFRYTDRAGGDPHAEVLPDISHRLTITGSRATIEVKGPDLPKVAGRLRVLRRQAHTREYVVVWDGPIIESDEGRLLAGLDVTPSVPTLKVRDA